MCFHFYPPPCKKLQKNLEKQVLGGEEQVSATQDSQWVGIPLCWGCCFQVGVLQLLHLIPAGQNDHREWVWRFLFGIFVPCVILCISAVLLAV